MTIQAEGNYEKAKAILPRPDSIKPEMLQALKKVGGVPVDIEPKFVTAEELLRSNP